MNAFKFLFSFLIFSTKVSYFSCVIRSIISYEIRNLGKRQKKKRISVGLHTEHWQRACSHTHTQSVNGWYAFEISLPYSAKQLEMITTTITIFIDITIMRHQSPLFKNYRQNYRQIGWMKKFSNSEFIWKEMTDVQISHLIMEKRTHILQNKWPSIFQSCNQELPPVNNSTRW